MRFQTRRSHPSYGGTRLWRPRRYPPRHRSDRSSAPVCRSASSATAPGRCSVGEECGRRSGRHGGLRNRPGGRSPSRKTVRRRASVLIRGNPLRPPAVQPEASSSHRYAQGARLPRARRSKSQFGSCPWQSRHRGCHRPRAREPYRCHSSQSASRPYCRTRCRPLMCKRRSRRRVPVFIRSPRRRAAGSTAVLQDRAPWRSCGSRPSRTWSAAD